MPIFFSGLLTEVQCQSKRLRKGGKGRGQEEEESPESRRVSSTSRLPGQVESRTHSDWMVAIYFHASFIALRITVLIC